MCIRFRDPHAVRPYLGQCIKDLTTRISEIVEPHLSHLLESKGTFDLEKEEDF